MVVGSLRSLGSLESLRKEHRSTNFSNFPNFPKFSKIPKDLKGYFKTAQPKHPTTNRKLVTFQAYLHICSKTFLTLSKYAYLCAVTQI